MKVFLVASIRGKEDFGKSYEKIVEALKKTGYQVFADHVLKTKQSDIDNWSNEKKLDFHKQVLDGIKTSDIVVAEISFPSMSIGYLVSFALECGKPTVVVYKGKEEPNILTAVEKAEKLFVLKYSTLEDLAENLRHEIEDAADQMDVRFNFFISPKIGVYLDWTSKNKKIPRAVYLRKLIEEDMKRSKEFKGK